MLKSVKLRRDLAVRVILRCPNESAFQEGLTRLKPGLDCLGPDLVEASFSWARKHALASVN